MTLTRRQSLLWASSLGTSYLLGACASTPGTASQGPGFCHHTLGRARITALSDGIGRRPLEEGFVKNVSLSQVQAALRSMGLPTSHLHIPYTCFVAEIEGRRYLLDTGFGDNGGVGSGMLHTHMQAAGIDPVSIHAVILSHLHGDHIQGLRRKDGTLVYPQATVYLPQPEADFWMDDARMQATAEGARGGFLAVRRVFTSYPKDQLRYFAPGADLAPGIGTQAAFGHSPGHTAIRIHSEGQRFTYIGDAAHLPSLFVANPDWSVQFDMHPELARSTRHALLAQMAEQGDWVAGYHFPLPGFGKIYRQGAGFHWKTS